MNVELTLPSEAQFTSQFQSQRPSVRHCQEVERLILSNEEAFRRGEESELRVALWLGDTHLFPWVTGVSFEKACNPYFDLTVTLDPSHPVTQVLNLPNNILRVEVKSSLGGRNRYVRHKRKNFPPTTWYENAWVVLPAGPHIKESKLKEQLTFQLLLVSKRYADATLWPELLECLHPSLVEAFLETVYTERFFSQTLLTYLGQSTNQQELLNHV